MLVAADKFKGSLTAVQVAERVTAGLRRVVPDLTVETLPVADGGDGTVAAAVAAGFERREVQVTGPLGEPVTAAFALRDGTAVVEMAEASGLQLLPPGVFAPLTANRYGRLWTCGPTAFDQALPAVASQFVDQVIAPRTPGQAWAGLKVPQPVSLVRQSSAFFTICGST